MSTTGKEYKLAIRIAGIIDKSFNTSLVAANSSLRKSVATIDKSFTELDRGFDTVIGAGGKAFQMLAAAAAVAASAIGVSAAAVIRVGMEFEKQMSAVQAISGASAGELEQMKEKARGLAQESVFSATEIGKAMEYMGMAGWKTEQILSGVEGVINLAAASGEDLAIVSDIVTDDLTAFHMEAGETARMVDVMAQAAMNSNTNVEMMGEAFKYAGTVAGAMGYQIEDIAIATGLMASSGIKASLAGTAIRNIITRMVNPTRESAEAMTALGLSLEKGDGSMHSFLEIMQQMRKGMSGMTETQKAGYASMLGGQRGMAGLLAIADSTDKQFHDLTEAIYHAEGAAQKMADIRLDNLAGDVQIFQDALADAGIELTLGMNGLLRGLVQMGTGFVNGAAMQIPKAVNGISAEFPMLQRKFRKFVQPVFSGIMGFGSFIIRHGDGIISLLAGIGTALLAYKSVSSITHLVKALFWLSKGQWAIVGVTALIGTLGTVFAAYKLHEREMVDQSLAAHFGDIALSMEDIQGIAERIVRSGSLGGVKRALEEFQDLDGISQTMRDALAEIEKSNWKVSIGMELSEEEKESYKQAIDGYVKAAQDYALQSQYAVSLNLQLIFSEDDLEGQNVVTRINQFYQDKYDELSALGTQLNDAVTEAFNDGLLDIKEAKVIADIQRKMAAIEEALATGEFDAQLSLLDKEYAGGGSLTEDSFLNLQDKLAEQVAEASEAYRESYIRNHAAIQAAYENGDHLGEYLNEAEYQKAMEELDAAYLGNIGALQAKAINFQLETIMEQYAGELGPAVESYIQKAGEIMAYYVEDGVDGWLEAPLLWDSIIHEFDFSTLDKTTRGAIRDLLKAMQPSIEEMQSVREQYEAAGKDIPEAILKGLSDFALLDVLAGAGLDAASAGSVLGEQLVESGYYDSFYKNLIDEMKEAGSYVPEEVVDGISGAAAEATADRIREAAEANIRPVVEGMYAWSQKTIEEYYAKNFQVATGVEIELDPIIRYGQAALPRYPLFDGLNLPKIDKNADGGIIRNRELSWLAEEGPEAVIPLDGSRNAVALWEKAGQLLGMDSAFGDLDLGGGGTVSVAYSPVLNFYGEAPNKDDLTEALDISQDRFDQMMDRYFKAHSRVSFG